MRGEQKENTDGGAESSDKSERTEEGNSESSGHRQKTTEEEQERDLPPPSLCEGQQNSKQNCLHLLAAELTYCPETLLRTCIGLPSAPPEASEGDTAEKGASPYWLTALESKRTCPLSPRNQHFRDHQNSFHQPTQTDTNAQHFLNPKYSVLPC